MCCFSAFIAYFEQVFYKGSKLDNEKIVPSFITIWSVPVSN